MYGGMATNYASEALCLEGLTPNWEKKCIGGIVVRSYTLKKGRFAGKEVIIQFLPDGKRHLEWLFEHTFAANTASAAEVMKEAARRLEEGAKQLEAWNDIRVCPEKAHKLPEGMPSSFLCCMEEAISNLSRSHSVMREFCLLHVGLDHMEEGEDPMAVWNAIERYRAMEELKDALSSGALEGPREGETLQ